MTVCPEETLVKALKETDLELYQIGEKKINTGFQSESFKRNQMKLIGQIFPLHFFLFSFFLFSFQLLLLVLKPK